MTDNYLVIDTETGGVDPHKHSLLQIAGIKWYTYTHTPLFEFYIRENNIIAEEKALEINKIDLYLVDLFGKHPKWAVIYLREQLDAAFGKDRERIVPVGHNVGFDFSFLKRLYRLADEDIFKDFHHRCLDTATILRWLMLTKQIPEKNPSSNFLFDFCHVHVPEYLRHTAMGDAMGTAQALTYLFDKYKLEK